MLALRIEEGESPLRDVQGVSEVVREDLTKPFEVGVGPGHPLLREPPVGDVEVQQDNEPLTPPSRTAGHAS